MARRGLMLVVVLLVAACGREGTPDEPTPTPRRLPAATTATEQPIVTSVPTRQPSPSASAGERVGSPAPPGCRNDTRERCGAFRFDPSPDDADVEVEVDFTPRSPKVGDTVTFQIRANDEDSAIVRAGSYRFGKGQPGAAGVDEFRGSCPRAYGPWDPPDERAGSAVQTLRHTYREAGEYTAFFTFYSHSYETDDHPWPDEPPGDGGGGCIDPLASAGKATVTVTVTD